MKKITITIIFFLTIILLTQLVLSATTTTDPFLQDFILREEIKTRGEIKQYFDQKANKIIDDVKKESKVFIDGNMYLLKEEIKGYTNKMLIKINLSIICAIIFGCGLWYLIKRKIDKITRRKEKITPVKLTPPTPPTRPTLPTFNIHSK